MTLQQQYRLQKFTRYSELNAYLLVAEQNNELLMKNHQSRPTGSLAYPEVNAIKNDTKSFMRGQGQSHGKGRGQFGKIDSHGHNRSFDRNKKNGRVYTHGCRFTRGNGQRTNNYVARNNKAKNVGKRKHKGESGPSQNTDGSCFGCDYTVKRVRLDNAGEFTSQTFNDYCMSVGIVVEHPVAHVHTQNRLAESLIKRLQLIARPLIMRTKLPVSVWGHAILHAASLIRIRPSANHVYSPMQLAFGQEPNISHL
ncbi:retrovirus-related pol polyprotein from transposon TNT 1-94, partial [Tanacetum coccineum]